MESFKPLISKAVPLDMANVDTDQIVPKQFLKFIHRKGYGCYLFYDWRFDSTGRLKTDFVLNNPKYAGREILLTRDNFGSGSSREHAVWAIRDFGFRAILAPSFADIFYNNCFKNGVLPIRLEHENIEYLFKNTESLELKIDLANQYLIAGKSFMSFDISEVRKRILLKGLDEIDMTLGLGEYILDYENDNSKFHSKFHL
jgi:3-isopropylmalate/(R)-2-methylmalate dehydratase small subunit